MVNVYVHARTHTHARTHMYTHIYIYIHGDACAYAITRGGPCTVGNSRHDLGPRELRRLSLARARAPARARRERASVNYMFAVSARITRYNRNYEPALLRVYVFACARTLSRLCCVYGVYSERMSGDGCAYLCVCQHINTIYISMSLTTCVYARTSRPSAEPLARSIIVSRSERRRDVCLRQPSGIKSARSGRR